MFHKFKLNLPSNTSIFQLPASDPDSAESGLTPLMTHNMQNGGGGGATEHNGGCRPVSA